MNEYPALREEGRTAFYMREKERILKLIFRTTGIKKLGEHSFICKSNGLCPFCSPQATRSRRRGKGGERRDDRPHHTVTTIFPTCWFDSRYRWASTIWSSGNVFAMIGLKLPSASPSLMNFFAASRRAGLLVISIIV